MDHHIILHNTHITQPYVTDNQCNGTTEQSPQKDIMEQTYNGAVISWHPSHFMTYSCVYYIVYNYVALYFGKICNWIWMPNKLVWSIWTLCDIILRGKHHDNIQNDVWRGHVGTVTNKLLNTAATIYIYIYPINTSINTHVIQSRKCTCIIYCMAWLFVWPHDNVFIKAPYINYASTLHYYVM